MTAIWFWANQMIFHFEHDTPITLLTSSRNWLVVDCVLAFGELVTAEEGLTETIGALD